MEVVALGLESLPRTLVAVAAVVDEDDDIVDLQSRALQLGDPLKHAAAADQDVIDHDDAITLLEVAFDQATGPMGFDFLAGVDQWFVQLQGQTGRRGQRSVGNTRDSVKLQPLHALGVAMQDPVEEVGIRDDLPQVDVVVENGS